MAWPASARLACGLLPLPGRLRAGGPQLGRRWGDGCRAGCLAGVGHQKPPRLLQSRREFSTGLALVDGTLGLLATAAKIYGVLLVGVFVLQRKLLFIPSNVVADPSAQGGKPEVVVLPRRARKRDTPKLEAEEERHAAVFFRPQDANAPVLVFFHGNADQVGWGPAFLGVHFAPRYGLGVYAVEYPGYGLAKPGSPSEANIYEAAEALLKHLEKELGVPRSRTVLFGQSIGCAVAIEMAQRGFGGKLVLLSPFTSVVDMSCAIYPFLKPALKLAPVLVRDPFDNFRKAPGVALPTLIIHGLDDSIVPASMGEELAARIPGAKKYLVPGMDHNDALDRLEVLSRIASFVREE